MSKNLLERKIVILKMGTKFQDAHESTKMGTNIAVKPRSDASNILKTLILAQTLRNFVGNADSSQLTNVAGDKSTKLQHKILTTYVCKSPIWSSFHVLESSKIKPYVTNPPTTIANKPICCVLPKKDKTIP